MEARKYEKNGLICYCQVRKYTRLNFSSPHMRVNVKRSEEAGMSVISSVFSVGGGQNKKERHFCHQTSCCCCEAMMCHRK